MKLKYLFLPLVLLVFCSCDTDGSDYEIVQVATPQIISKTDFRKSVEIKPARQIEEAGKIYAYQDYIFIGDLAGIHIIDNSQPEQPKAVAFIEIPKNQDVSVKDNYLYADSATDLLVFDISNINKVTEVERLEDVFDFYDFEIPIEADDVDFQNFDFQNSIIVGWTVASERRKIDDPILFADGVFDGAGNVMNSGESVVGMGGSLARFQIVEHYLYAVGSHKMTIFNIAHLEAPVLEHSQYVGWNIETMFQADQYLYLGSTNGMFIYTLDNPLVPEFVSEFIHWEGCDPVVVDGNYAYLTLRGGNPCGQLESVLEVVDISDKSNPTLAGRYTLENPYGLGVKGNTLYVCDGTSGLKLFNTVDPRDIKLLKTLKDIQSKDVIPLQNSLLMIGNQALYQYEYLENDLRLISTFAF
ncbi:LVIVD repeat-containing protein [Aestuariivivens sediminis]|uniref:LVIVD repeat-containing protein n=1 Tax=Aestuariivivens sediminis TaxID=2913557 RepID=UPI001F581CDA|nr:hypothetical protein [Aestuariivivens sediminis]